jgi:hypothetical protein
LSGSHTRLWPVQGLDCRHAARLPETALRKPRSAIAGSRRNLRFVLRNGRRGVAQTPNLDSKPAAASGDPEHRNRMRSLMLPRSRDEGPRRPRRRGRPPAREGQDSRQSRDSREGGFDRDRSEQEFTEEMHHRLQQFLASDEQNLTLEPMNSFKRRIVHNLAKEYQIETESRGEDRERHVFLVRTTVSATPAEAPRHQPGEAPPRAPHREPSEAPPRAHHREPREAPPLAPEQERTGERERPDDATDYPSSSRAWDFGSQTFPINPGEHGVHIAIKRDGSIEIFQEKDRNHVVAERLVTARQFRVRKGKIIQPGEPGW